MNGNHQDIFVRSSPEFSLRSELPEGSEKPNAVGGVGNHSSPIRHRRRPRIVNREIFGRIRKGVGYMRYFLPGDISAIPKAMGMQSSPIYVPENENPGKNGKYRGEEHGQAVKHIQTTQRVRPFDKTHPREHQPQPAGPAEFRAESQGESRIIGQSPSVKILAFDKNLRSYAAVFRSASSSGAARSTGVNRAAPASRRAARRRESPWRSHSLSIPGFPRQSGRALASA